MNSNSFMRIQVLVQRKYIFEFGKMIEFAALIVTEIFNVISCARLLEHPVFNLYNNRKSNAANCFKGELFLSADRFLSIILKATLTARLNINFFRFWCTVL